MATSSITKQFVLKDKEALKKLSKIAASTPDRKTTKESESLAKGREALKSF